MTEGDAVVAAMEGTFKIIANKESTPGDAQEAMNRLYEYRQILEKLLGWGKP